MKKNVWGRITALLGAVVLSTTAVEAIDFPEASAGAFGGVYQVTSSTDPMFPVPQTGEVFFDFGRGIQADKSSGNVAVSIRMNPHVRVKVLAWQYFPAQGKIVLGHRFAEGSKNAVALGSWSMEGASHGIVFKRGSYQVVLRRVDLADY